MLLFIIKLFLFKKYDIIFLFGNFCIYRIYGINSIPLKITNKFGVIKQLTKEDNFINEIRMNIFGKKSHLKFDVIFKFDTHDLVEQS